MNNTNKPNRLVRGGSWYLSARYCCSACRFFPVPENRSQDFGFRPVLTPTNKPNINMKLNLKLTKGTNDIQFKPVAGIDTLFAETPMTEAQWAFYSGVPCEPGREDYPKVNISWDDIKLMLVKMNALPEDEGGPPSGYEFDFPTEADWETACLDGSATEVFAMLETAHFNAYALALVKTKAPNGFGLYDLLGNVWEWCADEYES